jgi:hypothetical protein
MVAPHISRYGLHSFVSNPVTCAMGMIYQQLIQCLPFEPSANAPADLLRPLNVQPAEQDDNNWEQQQGWHQVSGT